MILGSFLDALAIPVVPLILIILSIIVQVGGFVFLIYRARAQKTMNTVNTAKLDKVTHIAGLVFIIYAVVDLIGLFACAAANDICRGLYHFPIGYACLFCEGKGGHTNVSDIIMLGTYFDVFIINSYVIAAIKTVQDFLDKKKIHLL